MAEGKVGRSGAVYHDAPQPPAAAEEDITELVDRLKSILVQNHVDYTVAAWERFDG